MGGLFAKGQKRENVVGVNNKIGREAMCHICAKVFDRSSTYQELNRHMQFCQKNKEKSDLEKLFKELRDTNLEIDNIHRMTTVTKHNTVSSDTRINKNPISTRQEKKSHSIFKEDKSSGLFLFDSKSNNNKQPIKKVVKKQLNNSVVNQAYQSNQSNQPNLSNFNPHDVIGFPFEEKYKYFRSHLNKIKIDWREGAHTLELDRDDILQQSVKQFTLINPYKELKINFKGEVSHDAGGLIREWYTVIFKEIQSEKLGICIF